jgi:hypothetical protein
MVCSSPVPLFFLPAWSFQPDKSRRRAPLDSEQAGQEKKGSSVGLHAADLCVVKLWTLWEQPVVRRGRNQHRDRGRPQLMPRLVSAREAGFMHLLPSLSPALCGG